MVPTPTPAPVSLSIIFIGSSAYICAFGSPALLLPADPSLLKKIVLDTSIRGSTSADGGRRPSGGYIKKSV